MDGSVSTLAPVFAAAFATQSSWDAFRVGLAASVGAGISMAFAEALSDDGSVTGRGRPLIRGVVTGIMTMAGGIGHTLPYLIADFRTATTVADFRRHYRTRGNQLDSPALHANSASPRRYAGCSRRSAGFHCRNSNRKVLSLDLFDFHPSKS